MRAFLTDAIEFIAIAAFFVIGMFIWSLTP